MVDYFPLLLHFLISLIKLILWLKFFYKQKAGRGHGWGGGGRARGSCSISLALGSVEGERPVMANLNLGTSGFPDASVTGGGWGTGRQSGSVDVSSSLASSRSATYLLHNLGQVPCPFFKPRIIIADALERVLSELNEVNVG